MSRHKISMTILLDSVKGQKIIANNRFLKNLLQNITNKQIKDAEYSTLFGLKTNIRQLEICRSTLSKSWNLRKFTSIVTLLLIIIYKPTQSTIVKSGKVHSQSSLVVHEAMSSYSCFLYSPTLFALWTIFLRSSAISFFSIFSRSIASWT